MRGGDTACAYWKGSMLVSSLVILAWAAAARGHLTGHLVDASRTDSAGEWHCCSAAVRQNESASSRWQITRSGVTDTARGLLKLHD